MDGIDVALWGRRVVIFGELITVVRVEQDGGWVWVRVERVTGERQWHRLTTFEYDEAKAGAL